MAQFIFALVIVVLCAASAAVAQTPGDFAIPKPYLTASECTSEQRAAALALVDGKDEPSACFTLHKWSFNGVALAFGPIGDPQTSTEAFHGIRRVVYRDQSARLRAERDMREAMPDSPPAHSTIPLSLDVLVRTPLGVFVNEPEYIGYADLIPLSVPRNQRRARASQPLLQLQVVQLRKESVFRLVLMSQISGTETIGQGYRMAEDWALILLGRERTAEQQ